MSIPYWFCSINLSTEFASFLFTSYKQGHRISLFSREFRCPCSILCSIKVIKPLGVLHFYKKARSLEPLLAFSSETTQRFPSQKILFPKKHLGNPGWARFTAHRLLWCSQSLWPEFFFRCVNHNLQKFQFLLERAIQLADSMDHKLCVDIGNPSGQFPLSNLCRWMVYNHLDGRAFSHLSTPLYVHPFPSYCVGLVCYVCRNPDKSCWGRRTNRTPAPIFLSTAPVPADAVSHTPDRVYPSLPCRR